MTTKRKFSLIGINIFLVMAGLYFGLPSLRSHVPVSRHAPEQMGTLIEKATDIEELRAVAKADIEAIHADRELASLFRDGLIAASTVAVVVGLINIVLVSFRRRKNEAVDSVELAGSLKHGDKPVS